MKYINNTKELFNINEPAFIDELKVTQVSSKDSIDEYLFEFELNDKNRTGFTFKWTENIGGVFDLFKHGHNHYQRYNPSYAKNMINSSVFNCAPLMIALNPNNKSVLSVSVLDSLNYVSIGMGAIEEDGLPECEVTLLKDFPLEQKKYSVVVRIDRRVIDFSQALKETTDFLYKDYNNDIPKDCYEPLYSTWYNFHKNVDQYELLEEMKLAKEYGLKTLIVDDGWQIEKNENNGAGYSVAGDWNVAKSKFPDLPKFIDECHKLDIKVMFWLAVPFVGHSCESYKHFKDKILWDSEELAAATLDARYKECRDYIANSCIKLVKNNGLDGLKLDFIDSFQNYQNVPFKEGMDIYSLPLAVNTLLSGLFEKLKEINPNIMIEYRENYTSPELLKTANMIRVGDCPIEYKTNYNDIAYLRLSTKVAVHSDMIKFNPIEELDHKARHLYASLFSVPQISFVLKDLNEEDSKLLKNYIIFHEQYRDIIFADNFSVSRNNGIISYSTNIKDEIRLIELFTNRTLEIADKETTIVNISGEKKLFFELDDKASYNICVYNYYNEQVDSFDVKNSSFVKVENKDLFIIKIIK